MKDHLESLEACAEDRHEEMTLDVPADHYRCGCGKVTPDSEMNFLSPDPYASPACGDCFEQWKADHVKDKKGFLQGVLDTFTAREGSGHTTAAVLGVKSLVDAMLVTEDSQIAHRVMQQFGDFGRGVYAISIQFLDQLDLASRRPLVLDNSAVEWLLRVALAEIHDLEVKLRISKREAERHDELLHKISDAVQHKSLLIEGGPDHFLAHIPPLDQPHAGLFEAIESLKKENKTLAAGQCSIIVGDDDAIQRCPITGEPTQ